MLRSSNNRAQQKKMAFLERNLEQLTHVQRQLVEQNSSLKKEVAIAERKLIARNERIQSLESLLQDSQEKLTAANHRFVYPAQCNTLIYIMRTILIGTHRFEAQLTAVKERLEAAKVGTRGLGNPSSFSLQGSRIAKPLRGGGGGDANGAVQVLSGVQGSAAQQEAQQPKRSSWFFDRK